MGQNNCEKPRHHCRGPELCECVVVDEVRGAKTARPQAPKFEATSLKYVATKVVGVFHTAAAKISAVGTPENNAIELAIART